MASSSAHRLPDGQPGVVAAPSAATTGCLNKGSKSNSNNQSRTQYRNHQRRQSCARLLPDISKLRLLSWLVEASSELINCDIAIMDGVYAKLNRSRESLSFWSNTNSPSITTTTNQMAPPAPPSVQPVANNIVISQRRRRNLVDTQSRNHHSLPSTKCTALAAMLARSPPRLSLGTDSDSIASSSIHPTGSSLGPSEVSQPGDASSVNDSLAPSGHTNEDFYDSNQSDDDDNSSAASSTTSSGIHGGNSLSSSVSSSSSAASSSSSSLPLAADSLATSCLGKGVQEVDEQLTETKSFASSAEHLSEMIRKTVTEHNYLQSLLVNVIRHHDRQRALLNQQRRRQISLDQSLNLSQLRYQPQRIDLSEIAEALDDGCLCQCHSQQDQDDDCEPTSITSSTKASRAKNNRSSTLPATSNSLRQQQEASNNNSNQRNNNNSPRKVRPFKKIRPNAANNSSLEPNRQDMINLLADKLCENCFETHYWLHGCSLKSMQSKGGRQELSSSQDCIAKRNATFIKLVQQQVRLTLSKSIELIDLIRKEIKSPESIKHKHLMRCFSNSIQLLTSVGNYVVPAQDISTFIPEVGQHQTTLYNLPASDFDHLLFYPFPNNSYSGQPHSGYSTNHYHLAQAPNIPIRRRVLQQKHINDTEIAAANGHSSPDLANQPNSITVTSDDLNSNDLHTFQAESSSGVSSNNSSASSSIARGSVQASSMSKTVPTSAQRLDSNNKTSQHELSLETIANLSRQQQNEDDLMFQSRPRFWQSSKFNFIKKLLHVKQQRLLRQQSKDRRIYNNKVQNRFRLVMMDLTHFNKSQHLLTTENGVNSLLTSMRNVMEFGLYLTLKLY